MDRYFKQSSQGKLLWKITSTAEEGIVLGAGIAIAQAPGRNVGGVFEEWLWPIWLGVFEPGWE